MIDWSNSATQALENGSGSIVVNMAQLSEFLADVELRLQSQSGFTVATLNLDHIVKLQRQPEFRQAYAAHSHVTADGNPIVWLSRLAGRKIALLPGSELIEPVLAIAERNSVPVAFFGSTEQSLTATADRLTLQFPELKIATTIAPPMGFDPTGKTADDMIAQLKDSGARLVFVALGAPKQEMFAVHASEQLPHVGFMSIGAGLDFISGSQTRAPKWVRALAAEWLWRMMQNPRRLAGRYGACLLILPKLSVSALRQRVTARAEAGL